MHNALAAHLRAATHSRRITPDMDHRVKRPVAQDLNIARGPMIPGLGSLNIRGAKSLNAKLGHRLNGPQPRPILRSNPLNLGIPLDHRLSAPAAQQLPLPHGPFMPGFGDIDQMFGEMDFVPGMGEDDDLAGQARASAHRKPILRSVQKPRIKGAPATSHPTTSASFMPGLGEEEDEDVVAFGHLSAAELAADEIPANTGAQAVAASTGMLTKLLLVAGAALALGTFLRFR